MTEGQLHQVIGVDIGGSSIKLGRYGSQGQCHQVLDVLTPQPATPTNVLEALVQAIIQVSPGEAPVKAIGVGLPGPVDVTGRISQIAINLRNWHDVPYAEWIEGQVNLPVILANDANCAGLGEAWLGAGQGIQNLVMLTLGTGVGGAVILDGKLFTGHQGTGGELGLITLNPDGPDCNSGNNGSLEQYVSVRAIRRETGMEPSELADKAHAGDQAAIEFWQNYGKLLGAGLTSLIYILTPEAIILGGGISGAADLFLPATWAEIQRRVLANCTNGLKLVTAELGNRAGTAGAAKLALQTFQLE
ncbi:MAG: ROK family protein [Microcoleaceae cyanobacterium]